jgi:hypothetical protein
MFLRKAGQPGIGYHNGRINIWWYEPLSPDERYGDNNYQNKLEVSLTMGEARQIADLLKKIDSE